MNLLLKPDNFKEHYIYFNESIKNTIMDDSSFIRIIYSNPAFTLNGIYFNLNFTNDKHLPDFYNNEHNIQLLDFIKKTETTILTLYNSDKNKVFQIYETIIPHLNKQISHISHFGVTKNKSTNIRYILKISGIWETNTNIGLTFKILDPTRP